MSWRIIEGDCRDLLRELGPGSVQTCVTSPPYFGLRDYGHAGQLGLEATPDEYAANLVAVFREVRRVLRDDGTVWLNLGDSYANSPRGNNGDWSSSGLTGATTSARYRETLNSGTAQARDKSRLPGIKQKDLLGIPWMVAFALRANGWYLRSDIIWSKPNPMPESVTDRPTKAHEYLFLLSKGPRYFYDADAIREDGAGRLDFGQMTHPARLNQGAPWNGGAKNEANGRNRRSVWTVATQPFPGAHFATFPPKLIEPCILAGSSPKACGVCGAPWRRVVERNGYDNGDGSPGERGLGDARSLSRIETGRSDGFTKPPRNAARSAETVGWESSCQHNDDTGRSVVLDPFAGAGTTGVVAAQHGRQFIGIELSPEYARMARLRIALEGRPGGIAHHEPDRPIDGQLTFEGAA